MKDKSVCFIIPSLSSGGAERVVSILASSLAEQEKSIFLIVHRHASQEYEISGKVKTIFLDEGRYSKNILIARIQRIFKVRKFIKDNKIDYVVPFLDSCMKHTYIATRGLNTKFVATLRNNPKERSRKEARICDFITKRADANFVQNEEQKAYFDARVQNKTFIVPNPVNDIFLSNEKKYKDKIRNIIAIGRLSNQKNYHRLLSAIEIVSRDYPDIRLSIYGEGPSEESIKKEIEEKKLSVFVRLMGRTNDVLQALGDNDLYVMSSDYEGMPNALMEAMAYGMPCVSTDCPTGPKNLIGDNERGRLATMDEGNSLAREICYSVKYPEEAIGKGILAKEYIRDHYSADIISSELYNELLRR